MPDYLIDGAGSEGETRQAMSMDTKKKSGNLPEIWGGIECSVNRVGNTYSDQLAYAGCYESDQYLHEILKLGVHTIRFPVLWEKHQPSREQIIDWSWADRQLNILKTGGAEPVIGLVHHGSGPAFTSLADPDFPGLMAQYAGQVAERFPWITYYTPVNEPLTTARFSGLYGHWYPHASSDNAFLTMLLHQLKAVVLSMQAIRKVNPGAQLVQTEDIGKTYSVDALQYQAEFENQRRWLTYDILCGKLGPHHPLWNYFIHSGIKKNDLLFFRKNQCPPQIIGLNYYVTSERFLDNELARYPVSTHGGNGLDSYADIEAVRAAKPAGIGAIIKETWARYNIPMALTEVHLGCSREEQMRWFMQVWTNCCSERSDGIDIRAVTAWSLMGSYDWDSLLTKCEGHYESGVFDNHDHYLRKTALWKMVNQLSEGKPFTHPLLLEKGWWQRPQRLLYHATEKKVSAERKAVCPPLVIIGKGTLGSAFAHICEHRNIPCILLSRKEIDILQAGSVEKMIATYKPWAVINAAGYVRVDEAEHNQQACFLVNAVAPALISSICSRYSLPFVTFSSDLVFKGDQFSPYLETDTACPLSVYGESKLCAEKRVLAEHPHALVIRSSSFFGPWDHNNFPCQVIEKIRSLGYCEVVDDIRISPTYVPDLVHAALNLLIDEEKGIWHLCNEGDTTWVDFAIEVAIRAGHSPHMIRAKPIGEMHFTAARPRYSVLMSGKGYRLPKLTHAMDRFFHEKAV